MRNYWSNFEQYISDLQYYKPIILLYDGIPILSMSLTLKPIWQTLNRSFFKVVYFIQQLFLILHSLAEFSLYFEALSPKIMKRIQTLVKTDFISYLNWLCCWNFKGRLMLNNYWLRILPNLNGSCFINRLLFLRFWVSWSFMEHKVGVISELPFGLLEIIENFQIC